MLKFCFIDTETTGTDFKRHGIHQVSLIIDVLHEDGTLVTVEKRDFHVCPDPSLEIDDEALKISGVKREDLQLNDSEKIFHDKFVNILYKYKKKYDKRDKFYFVGYNGRFDADMVNELFKRVGDPYFFGLFWYPIIDVAVLSLFPIVRQRPFMENFKLGTVCKEYGIQISDEGLHDAMYDIEITRDLFYKLGYADYMKTLCDPNFVVTKQNPNALRDKLLNQHEKLSIENVNHELVQENTNDVQSSKSVEEKLLGDQSKDAKINPVQEKPKTDEQEIYSRKFVITFGKHSGLTVEQIMETNASYIVWIQKNKIRDIVFSEDIMRDAIKKANEQRQEYEENKRKSNYREFEGKSKRVDTHDDSTLGYFFESHIGDDCPF